ncbi:hypothetical protein Dsin_000969 [Dipteronia sinensis]|uniref:Uncharacterized protein n=1 Tax=Dipteronia sinensis TaxID=43782 RepID=A0AAE0EHX2_9ROSI|nr:hypothetical protein Dsin_000969 [Dipteronia sinensis]
MRTRNSKSSDNEHNGSLQKKVNVNRNMTWNLDEEICKVIETSVALGFNFNGKKNEIGEEVARRELEDVARGLGKREKRRVVRSLVEVHKLTILFLKETKLSSYDYRLVKSLGGQVGMDWGPTTFCFYNYWLEEKELMKELSNGWSQHQQGGSASQVLNTKIKASKYIMKKWNHANKKNSFSVDQWEKKLGEIDKIVEVEGWSIRLRNYHLHLLSKGWRSLMVDEQIWRQKSRLQWLKGGDKNTKFFYLLVNDRRMQNLI